jgi:YesN/AraC family two-component response regulator
VTDMMMPNVDGAGVIDGVKKMNPTAKIVSISGISHKRVSLLDAGVTHFLLKPYTAERLLSTIKEALES